MKALLHADWLRFRRRKDFWIIAIAVLVIGGVGFVAAYRSDVQDPPRFDLAEFNSILDTGFFNGMTPEDIAAVRPQLIADQQAASAQAIADRNQEQLTLLQKYDLAQTPFTLLGSGLVPMLALVLAASLAVGDEFRFGTIRTSLLAAGERRRFLLARLVSLFVMTVGLFGAMVVLALALGIGLRLVGAEVNSSIIPIDPGTGLAWLGAQILATMVVISLGLALTVVLRSGALPLLLIILAGLIELFISALPIFAPGQLLSGVPQAFLTNSIRLLTSRLGLDTHAIALAAGENPYTAIELPLIVVAGIVAAWGLLFLVVADRRFRTMDVVE